MEGGSKSFSKKKARDERIGLICGQKWGKMAAKTNFLVDLSNYMTHRAEISSSRPQVSQKLPCGSLKLELGAELVTGFEAKVYEFLSSEQHCVLGTMN